MYWFRCIKIARRVGIGVRVDGCGGDEGGDCYEDNGSYRVQCCLTAEVLESIAPLLHSVILRVYFGIDYPSRCRYRCGCRRNIGGDCVAVRVIQALSRVVDVEFCKGCDATWGGNNFAEHGKKGTGGGDNGSCEGDFRLIRVCGCRSRYEHVYECIRGAVLYHGTAWSQYHHPSCSPAIFR